MLQCRAFVVAVLALALAGCGAVPKHQVIDGPAAARVRGVVIVRQAEQDRFLSAISDPVPTVTGPSAFALLQLGIILAQVADAKHKGDQLSAAVGPLHLRLREDLAERLRVGLAGQGFDARTAVTPEIAANDPTPTWLRSRSFDELLPWLREHEPADAALVVLLQAGVWKDVPSQEWCPTLAVTAQGLEIASGSVLYEDSFSVGCSKPAFDLRRIDVAAEHRFADFDALLADPARVGGGWQAGVRAVADAILQDIDRRAPR